MHGMSFIEIADPIVITNTDNVIKWIDTHNNSIEIHGKNNRSYVNATYAGQTTEYTLDIRLFEFLKEIEGDMLTNNVGDFQVTDNRRIRGGRKGYSRKTYRKRGHRKIYSSRR